MMAVAILHQQTTPPTNNTTNTNSDPYVNSKCYWTVDIDSEGNIGDKTESIIINKKTGSYAFCVVSNYPEVLNTDELIVDIYKKSGDEYKFVETKEYTLSSTTVKTTYFKYSFYEKGDYKFAVYNKNSKWINTSYLTVKYK